MRRVRAHTAPRPRLGVAQRAEALRSANLLRGAGLRAAAAVVERDVARRARLGR
ncbi:MAG: hypothetical protein ACXVZL_02445 [Gaiellaceae bacterium]